MTTRILKSCNLPVADASHIIHNPQKWISKSPKHGNVLFSNFSMYKNIFQKKIYSDYIFGTTYTFDVGIYAVIKQNVFYVYIKDWLIRLSKCDKDCVVDQNYKELRHLLNHYLCTTEKCILKHKMYGKKIDYIQELMLRNIICLIKYEQTKMHNMNIQRFELIRFDFVVSNEIPFLTEVNEGPSLSAKYKNHIKLKNNVINGMFYVLLNKSHPDWKTYSVQQL
jgi:hypothetical protein